MTHPDDERRDSFRQAWRRLLPLLTLVVATLGLRTAVMLVRGGQLQRDPDGYRLIAENLVEHGVYSRSQVPGAITPTAFRPPLYPLVLAILSPQGEVTVFVVAVLHVLLGGLTVLLAWILARRWGLGPWSYLVAAAVACDPILLNQSTEVMTETMATLLALACLLALTRLGRETSWKSGALTGAVFGVATLCRPTFLVWLALAATWQLWRQRGRRLTAVGMMVVAYAAVMLPWVARNAREMGKPVLATTHGGYTLLLGNNPAFYQHLRNAGWGSVWDARELLPLLESVEEPGRRKNGNRHAHPEIVQDRRLYELAWRSIRNDPGAFAWASLVRVARLWTPVPHRLSEDESLGRRGMRWVVAFWYGVVFALALVGCWSHGRAWRQAPGVWGVLCVIAFTLLHAVYWSNMRMRAPAMPVVYLAMAYGCRQVCNWETLRKLFSGNAL